MVGIGGTYSELLKSFHSDIQDLQTTFAPELCRIEPKLVGGIEVTWRFRIVKFVPFQYPKMATMKASLKIWKCSRMVSRIKLNICGRCGETWIFRTAKFVPFVHPGWLSWQPS